MTTLELIRSYLLSVTGVTDLLPDNGIYTDALPQSVQFPAIVLQVIGTEHEYDLQGAAGCVLNRLRVEAFGMTRLASDAVTESVRQALQGFSGPMLTDYVHSAQLVSYSAAVETPRDGSDNRQYIGRSSYEIYTPETIPTP